MCIKEINKKVAKDFKEEYLNKLILECSSKKEVVNKINKLINECRKNLNLHILRSENENYWLVRGWSLDEANEKLKELKDKRKPKYTIFSYQFWINKGLSKDEAIKKVYDIQKKNNEKFNKKRQANPDNYNTSSPMTIEFWVRKGLSEDEAKIKIKSQRKLNKEYWTVRGFSEEESVKRVTEYQKENYEKHNKKKEENPELYKDKYPVTIEYWLKKTNGNIEEAKKLLSNHQTTFTLEKCIKKYGEEKGLDRWNERQRKWKEKVFNEDQYIGRGESILANNIISEIIKIDKSELLYGKNEKFIYDSEYNRAYKYDLTKLINKRIIEINGTYWHCKPSLYESEYFHKVKMLKAKEIWEYDKRKREVAENHGYKILTIWEDDFYNNPQYIIDKCCNFLMNE